MTFKRLSMGSLLIAGLSLPGIKSAISHSGDQSPDLTSLSDEDLRAMTIQLERTGCYGNCPAYSVTIHGDGRVEYNGKSDVKEIGTREGKIEANKMRILALTFEKMKFCRVVDDYSEAKCKGPICTDMPTAIMELGIKGATHRVNHNYGCRRAPKALFELESLIDKSANVEAWTGDVSRAGPMATSCFGRN